MDDEQTYRKHLQKFKKSEIIEFLIRKDKEEKERVEFQIKKNKKLGRTIQRYQRLFAELKNELKEERKLKSQNFYSLNHMQRVFIESVTNRGMIRTYDGRVLNESISHIKLEIQRASGKPYWYVIDKATITGMKIYRPEE